MTFKFQSQYYFEEKFKLNNFMWELLLLILTLQRGQVIVQLHLPDFINLCARMKKDNVNIFYFA